MLRAKLAHEDDSPIDFFDVQEAITTAYERFVEKMIDEAGDRDRIFITFRNTNENRELYITFTKKNFDRDEFLARAYKLAQSSGNFIDGSVLEIKIQIIQNVSGSGKNSVDKLLPGSIRANLKRSVVNIINNDHRCGYIAVALGKYFVDNPKSSEKWKHLRKSLTAQSKLAGDLFTELNLDCSSSMDMNKLADIQNKLRDYQIIVVERRTHLKIYAGPDSDRKIILEYVDPPHFNTITSIKSYMDCDDFCTRCWKKLNTSRSHICEDCCPLCGAFQMCVSEEKTNCANCHLDFKSEACYNNHITNKNCSKRVKYNRC